MNGGQLEQGVFKRRGQGRVDKTWEHWKHASGTFESETHTNKQPSLIVNKIYEYY